MNIMRKFLGGSAGGQPPGGARGQEYHPEQELLGLAHLKKLYSEYSNPSHPLSSAEREAKLYSMLPLFCKIFNSVPPSVITEKFTDATSFTQACAKLLVTEVRRRASNQSTEAAASAIAAFLEVAASEADSAGWMLVSTVNLLAAEGETLVEVMTAASVPSTLVKCLYLFFDLPDTPETGGQGQSEAETEAEFTPRERRVLLQKMFMQVLLRLCAHIAAVEELARKDDLTLLFSAISSVCPPHNMMWRKTSSDVLLTISRHSLSQPVVSYLHNKGCISLCIENMQKGAGGDITPLEIVEMFVSIFCFLKDSSSVSQTLLDDFRTCQGYIFLSEFLLKLEQDTDPESTESIRNLVLLVASLAFCGHTELPAGPVQAASSLYQLPDFEMPVAENRGSTVRNLQAFQVLQSVFLKCSSPCLGGTILDAISTIYHGDNANYFLLQNQHTLSQAAEKIASKPRTVQEKFFQLIEFLVHHLQHIPTKELIAISLLLKSKKNLECCVLAVQSLISILKSDNIFKDVFREVGMVEVLVCCLSLYIDYLGAEDKTQTVYQPSMVPLGEMVIIALTELLSTSAQNAGVFRELGGAGLAGKLVNHSETRDPGLGLLQQLVVAGGGGGDEDMTGLLDLLHVCSVTELALRTDILRCLVGCLKESHRCRTVFRRVGGFVYLMSVLVGLEGSLSSPCSPVWKCVERRALVGLLHQIFATLATAMRYEPANAKFFYQEIAQASLAQALRLLGCFSQESGLQQITKGPEQELLDRFQTVFSMELPPCSLPAPSLPPVLDSCCIILRLLHDLAIDAFKPRMRSKSSTPACSTPTPSLSTQSSVTEASTPGTPGTKKKPCALPLNQKREVEPVLVHSGALLAILQLLPSMYHTDHQEESSGFQLFTAETIKSVLRTERNQQLMCDVQLMAAILSSCKKALEDETHLLHSPFQYLLERLAAQKLQPDDLRQFLRLGHPLASLSDDQIDKMFSEEAPANQKPGGGFVPLTRVKTLVSMTTPKDLHIQNNSILPPFVEFDMSSEGFGCLYIPSLAPQAAHGTSVVATASLTAGQEATVTGGVGVGDRAFPPQQGFSYSTWICVDRFSDPRADPHPVRILTLARTGKKDGTEQNLLCLSIAISTRDKAIIVSCSESPADQSNDWQPEFSGEWGARVWFPDIMKEGEWHHLVFVFSRQVVKNSAFTLYVNGQQVANNKMHYPPTFPGGGTSISPATSVYGWIGTPPAWRRPSRLAWKQGPCIMFEEVATPALASLLHKLGPHYLGSLQAPQVTATREVLTSQIAEERITFGLNAVAMTEMTLAKIRKVYSKVDNKAIAKQLGMTTHENATPIRVIHNSAGHLLGPARSLGGVVVGYLGVRVFTPQPVSKVIQTVGGCNVLLGLIAMARDVESLYAGVKALVCVLKSNPFSRAEMEQISGYQVLAMLLRKKSSFLNSHILHLIFTLVGTIDAGKEVGGIPNLPAFRDLLCDLELWHQAPAEVEKSLFEHFFELISDIGIQRSSTNIRVLREYHLVEKLLVILKKSPSSSTTTLTLLNVLHALLCTSPRVTDVLCFVQFTASTLTTPVEDEKCVELVPGTDGTECKSGQGEDSLTTEQSTIILRNRCLKLFFSLLYMGKRINQKYCEEIMTIVGFDWVQLFLLTRLHPTTTIWALRILMTLLSIPSLLAKFREGSCNGGWLMKSELVLQNKMGAALGQTSSSSKVKQMRIRHDIFSIPGFQLFNWLMPRHIAIPEVYFLMLAMVLGQPVKSLPDNVKLDLDSIWNYIFGSSASEVLSSDLSSRVTLCGEAMVAVLGMVRMMLNSQTGGCLPTWLEEYPVTLTQFLFYLYHNVHDFMPVFLGGNVLSAVAATLFPLIPPSPPSSLPSSPSRPALLSLPSTDDSLTNHPAKRNVMSFLRVIVVDSLSLPTSPKAPPAIDSLLDAQPDLSSMAQQNRFQTDLLTLIMDHLVAADILIGEQAALPIVPGGSANHIAPNVFYLASRLVDKLWQGVFKKNADEVFQFILKLISQAKRRSGTSMLSLEGIFRQLNRTILFMLSRPVSGVADQMALLEVLHKLMRNKAVLFSRDNPEIEFFGCLTFCLLQLTAGLVVPIDGGGSKTLWHLSPTQDPLPEGPEAVAQHQGQNLLANAAARLWEEMFFNKKSALEEVTKVSFPYGNKTPTLESMKETLQEPVSKVWVQYIEMERKACYQRIPAWEIHTHLQSKLQQGVGRLTGGLKRLTSVTSSSTKTKKEEEKKIEPSQLPFLDVEVATINHINIVCEVVSQHETQRQQTEEHLLQFAEEQWLLTEGQLTRERGLWGPASESRLAKWQMDVTEGPSRMRKRLIRDEQFYLRYPYRPSEEDGERPLKYKRPSSRDSKLWFERHHNLALFEREEKALELEYDDCDIAVPDRGEDTALTIDEQIREIGFKGLKHAPVDDGEDEEAEEKEEEEEEKKSEEGGGDPSFGEPQKPGAMEEFSSAYQTVMRLLENGERIVSMYRVARIQGLDIVEGLLLFGKEHFYVIDGFTIVNQREVHDIDFIPANQYDPIIPTVPGQAKLIKPKRTVSKFSFEEVAEVHKRRYLLQPIAVEVFTSNGQNYLLAFQKQFRSKVYSKFLLMATSILENAALSVSGQGRTANVEQGSGLFSSLIGETSVTQRWVRGEVSNFQYLMALNTLAGRSYNDLMQYPVFPWVLADYNSEELDLSNPRTFRNLSRPMGAQTAARLDQFKKRYRDWDDAGTDSPPYHYGTHYSSAMIVSSYLVRTEPFTQHFLHLQGGHFDLADRMFHSIGEAWESASKNNMADVRELIPEFFYLPEFLSNQNNFDMGTKQSGEALNDILLPPWAKGDPREFIRVHREALESDYVSSNLHKWIDLIFGFRQQGEAAAESANVYHHLFYEGNVDIFSIDDPLQRNATIGFINNFGQIPKQLFKKAHPAKKISTKPTGVEVSGSSISSKVFFHNLTNLRPSLAPVKELKGAVGEIQHSERLIYAVEQNKVLVPGNCNRYLAWGFADQSFRLGTYDTDKAVFVCEPNYLVGEVLTCVCPNPRLVLTAGTSSVVCVWLYSKKLKQLHLQHSLYGHTDAVTCLAASPGWGIAVSGSRDQTAIIWDLSRFTYVKNLPGHAGPVAAVSINELTGDIVSCAGSFLYLWDVNGQAIARVDTVPSPGAAEPVQVLCVAQSQWGEWDRQNVIVTGSSDGVVRMWSLDYVEVPAEGSAHPSAPSPDPLSEVSSMTRLAKKMSVSVSGDCLTSLRDAVARQKEGVSLHSELGELSLGSAGGGDSSDTEDCEELEVDKEGQEGGSAISSPELDIEPSVLGSPRSPASLTSPTSPAVGDPAPEVRVTSSSADDSFVVIDAGQVEEGVEVTPDGPAMRPGDGYVWSRQLVFRAKLTQHTAFERADNTEPAAVTALAVSKDHRTLFVGDERGRVFSWVVGTKPGKGFVDHWVKDNTADSCHDCTVRFTIYERRHHCRNCGKLYCSSCSRYQAEIPRLAITQSVRVCRSCFTTLNMGAPSN